MDKRGSAFINLFIPRAATFLFHMDARHSYDITRVSPENHSDVIENLLRPRCIRHQKPAVGVYVGRQQMWCDVQSISRVVFPVSAFSGNPRSRFM